MIDHEITNLDKKVAVIEQKIDNLSDKIAVYQSDNKEDHKAVRDLIVELDEKKAGKWVEKAVIGVAVFIITAVGSALLATVFK